MNLQSYITESAYDRPDYSRLTTASLGRSAAVRAEVASRLLLDNSTDCRAFDNCFEMGDAEAVIAQLVEDARNSPALRLAIQCAWSQSLDADGWPNGWLEIHTNQFNPLQLL